MRFIRMIKIFSLTYKDSTSGGPYTVATDYKNALDKNFFYVRLTSFMGNLAYNYIFNNNKIKRFINNFDVVHVHNVFSIKDIIILKIAESLAIPSILSVHGNLNKWSMKKS